MKLPHFHGPSLGLTALTLTIRGFNMLQPALSQFLTHSIDRFFSTSRPHVCRQHEVQQRPIPREETSRSTWAQLRLSTAGPGAARGAGLPRGPPKPLRVFVWFFSMPQLRRCSSLFRKGAFIFLNLRCSLSDSFIR